MTEEQIQSARTLLTQPEHTVSSIAKLLRVSRSTIYKHVPELGKQPIPPLEAEQAAPVAVIEASPMTEQPNGSAPRAADPRARPATTGRPTRVSSSCTATDSPRPG
jgi:hypothetical protein